VKNVASRPPMSLGTKIAILGSILAIVSAAVVAGFLIVGRPKPPPISDPNAGLASAEFCVNAIWDAVKNKALEISEPAPGRKFVRAVQYTNGAVRVLYDIQPGQNVENAEYSVAVFITSLFGESTSPAWKLFGEFSDPWLRCTEAVQYFEQERAKDVARELQNWVFGPPAPESTLEGPGQLTSGETATELGTIPPSPAQPPTGELPIDPGGVPSSGGAHGESTSGVGGAPKPIAEGDITGTYNVMYQLSECRGLNTCDQLQESFNRGRTQNVGSCDGNTCELTFADTGVMLPIEFNGTAWHGSGNAPPEGSFTCYGAIRNTSIDLTLTVLSSAEVNGVWTATLVEIMETNEALPASSDCPTARTTQTSTAEKR
jgi:hypothetical protein